MGSSISSIYDRYETGYLPLCEKLNIPEEDILDIRGDWYNHFDKLLKDNGYEYKGVLHKL